MSVNEKQVGGNHYKSQFQHWDVLIALGFGPEYFLGQASKYFTRWRKKNGLRDLRKGQHFIDKLVSIMEERGEDFLTFDPWRTEPWPPIIKEYAEANDLNADESLVLTLLFSANTLQHLKEVSDAVDTMAVKSIQAGTHGGALAGDNPIAVEFDFIEYGEGHETIKWRNRKTGEVIILPIDMPPS